MLSFSFLYSVVSQAQRHMYKVFSQPLNVKERWVRFDSEQYVRVNIKYSLSLCDLLIIKTCNLNRALSSYSGSILASLDTFKKMWVSKREYEEDRARAIHRKTF